MSMSWAESELRGTGDPHDLAFANILATIVETRGDIALPPGVEALNSGDVWELNNFTLPDEIIGALVLAGSEDGGYDAQAVVGEATLAETLRFGAETLVSPYSTMMRSSLPASALSERAKARLIKKRERINHNHSFNNVVERDGSQIKYDYGVSYSEDGEDHNLSYFTVVVDEPGYIHNSELSVNFNNNGSPSSVTLSWGHDTFVLPRLLPKPLTAFMFKVFGEHKVDKGVLLGYFSVVDQGPFDYTIDKSSIEFSLGEKPALDLRSRDLSVRYRINDSPTDLERVITGVSGLAIKKGEQLPEHISSDHFLGMLHQALQFIPTEKLD